MRMLGFVFGVALGSMATQVTKAQPVITREPTNQPVSAAARGEFQVMPTGMASIRDQGRPHMKNAGAILKSSEQSSKEGRAARPLDVWTPGSRAAGITGVSGITYGNGQFAAVGQAGKDAAVIIRSSDATTWEEALRIPYADSIAVQPHHVTYGNGVFVAVGGIYGAHVLGGAVFTSSDAVVWTPHVFWGYPALQGAAYGNGQFVAVGWGAIVTSVDGARWRYHDTDDTDESLSQIVFGNDRFVALARNRVASSRDGVHWLPNPLRSDITLKGMAYGSGHFVVVGGDWNEDIQDLENTIFTSPNGETWTERSSGVISRSLEAVAYGNGRFVAAGSDGCIVSSQNAIDWTENRSGTEQWIRAITHGRGHFVVAADGGTLFKSGRVVSLAFNLPQNKEGFRSAFLSLEGEAGREYIIQTSRDLATWRDFLRITGTEPTQMFRLPWDADSDQLFYRAISP